MSRVAQLASTNIFYENNQISNPPPLSNYQKKKKKYTRKFQGPKRPTVTLQTGRDLKGRLKKIKDEANVKHGRREREIFKLQPHVRFALDVIIQGRHNDEVAKISNVGSYSGAMLSQYNGPWRKLWSHLKCFCECLNWDDAIIFQLMF